MSQDEGSPGYPVGRPPAAQARLEREQTRTRTDLDQARLSIPRAQAAIDEARSKLADIDAAFRAQAGAELAQAQGELAKLSEQMPALEDRATRTIVRAPMDGRIAQADRLQVGSQIVQGLPVVTLVATGTTYGPTAAGVRSTTRLPSDLRTAA